MLSNRNQPISDQSIHDIIKKRWDEAYKSNKDAKIAKYLKSLGVCTDCLCHDCMCNKPPEMETHSNKVYIAVCAKCGDINGVYFEYPDSNKSSMCMTQVKCHNKKCSDRYCKWINEAELN